MCEMNDFPKGKEYSRKNRLIRGRVGNELSFLQKQSSKEHSASKVVPVKVGSCISIGSVSEISVL